MLSVLLIGFQLWVTTVTPPARIVRAREFEFIAPMPPLSFTQGVNSYRSSTRWTAVVRDGQAALFELSGQQGAWALARNDPGVLGKSDPH